MKLAITKFGALIPSIHLVEGTQGAIPKTTFSNVVKELNSKDALQIRNVYSPTNKKINWIIRKLLVDKKITEVRYRDCSFRVKLTNSTEYTIVITIECAERLNQEAGQQAEAMII